MVVAGVVIGRVMMVAAALLAAPVALTACAVVEEVQTSLFDTTKVNLADSSYAAADMLAQQTRSRMDQATPLKIAVLTDVTTPTETTAFGQQVSNQLGSRFVQLGYNVQSVPLTPDVVQTTPLAGGPVPIAPNTNAPQPVQMGMQPKIGRGDAIITGTYTRMKDTLQVSLKVLQAPDQKIIAAYDYTLPMTRDLRDISMSAAERKQREEESMLSILGANGKVEKNPE